MKLQAESVLWREEKARLVLDLGLAVKQKEEVHTVSPSAVVCSQS